MTLDGDYVHKRTTDVARPRKWDAYERGAKVPIDRAGPRNAIEQAERQFPGSARWFRSPLWSFLKRDAFDAKQFEDALRTLDPAVVSLLFEAEPPEPGYSTRQRPFDENTVSQLVELGSFDSLVAAVLLVGLSEAIASPNLRTLALNAYVELQAPLRNTPLLNDIYPELLTQIDLRCKHWIYLSSNQRMDVVIFWKGVAENLESSPDNKQLTLQR